MNKQILYYPILPHAEEVETDKSKIVREFINNELASAEIITRDESKADAYLVATGDGGFMKTARAKYNQGKVFFGINSGTVGFLLNPISCLENLPKTFAELTLVNVKLIKATFYSKNNPPVSHLAFNDIFIGGNVADFITFGIQGEFNGFPHREKITGSGVVISTPQGSTGYALKALGSSAVLPLDSNIWIIGGIATGPYPNDHVAPQKIEITINSRNTVNGYADGYTQEVKDIEKVIIEPTDFQVSLGFIKSIDFISRRRYFAQEVEKGGHFLID